MRTPIPEASRLWLPPLTLAGCVRAVLLRDTRGLSPAPADNYWPASPYITLYAFFEGSGRWLSEPGFLAPPPDFRHSPSMVGGPFAGPTHTVSDGAANFLMVCFLPDAFAALTGLAPDAWLDRCEDIGEHLPAEWQAWAAALHAAPDEAARLASLEAFLTPRWQNLALTRPLGRRYADWVDALAVRAATSRAGRSLRQIERRVKAWAGLSMRELRAVSRAEAAFLHVIAHKDSASFSWAGVAAETGYADQSHLCRETRRLTGFSPEALRRQIDEDEAFWAYRLWR